MLIKFIVIEINKNIIKQGFDTYPEAELFINSLEECGIYQINKIFIKKMDEDEVNKLIKYYNIKSNNYDTNDIFDIF